MFILFRATIVYFTFYFNNLSVIAQLILMGQGDMSVPSCPIEWCHILPHMLQMRGITQSSRRGATLTHYGNGHFLTLATRVNLRIHELPSDRGDVF